MHRPSCEGMEQEREGERISWKVGNMSCCERGGLGGNSVQRKQEHRKGRQGTNQKIRSIEKTSVTSTSPSK